LVPAFLFLAPENIFKNCRIIKSKAELIDRGIDREVSMLEVRKGDLNLKYKYSKQNVRIEEYWE